jgi:hypothetical protein
VYISKNKALAWAAVQKQEETNGFDLFQDFFFFFFVSSFLAFARLKNVADSR